MMPVLFQIGNMTIYSYGVILLIGFVSCLFFIFRKIRKVYLDEEKSFDVLFLSIIGSIIGARLFFVIEHFDTFAFNFLDWVLINAKWGFSFWGAAGGYLVIYLLMVRKYKLPSLKMLDVQIIPLNLFWIFAQIAILFSGSEVGTPTRMPWGVIFFSTVKRHPVSLYKTISLVVTILLLWRLEKVYSKKRFPSGMLFFSFIIIQSIFFFILQFFIEENLIIAKIFRPDQFIYLTLALLTGILLYNKLGRSFKNDIGSIKPRIVNLIKRQKNI